MKDYSFNRQEIMNLFNGKVKEEWSDTPSNEVDAIQKTFTFLDEEDLARAHSLFNLALKHVNGNTMVQAEGTYKEYEEARDAFFAELGFEVSGRTLVEAEIDRER